MVAKEAYDGLAAQTANSDEDIVAVNIDEDTVADWSDEEERKVKRK